MMERKRKYEKIIYHKGICVKCGFKMFYKTIRCPICGEVINHVN